MSILIDQLKLLQLAFHDSDSKFKNRLLDRQPEIYGPIFYYPHFQPTLPSVDHMAAINVVQLRAYDIPNHAVSY